MTGQARSRLFVAAALALYLVGACMAPQRPGSGERHRWWQGLGPVLPHDTFPADCRMCHLGGNWNRLRADFEFDHEGETGVPLSGAHAEAQCLLCHNDRGPIDVFAAQGCAGCHEDVHRGSLGRNCDSCHNDYTWEASGQVEFHNRTRFPLSGSHAAVSCNRCHPGAFIGRFTPTSVECVSCHLDDVQRTVNPPHLQLGWVDNCDRCHIPTLWRQAEVR